MLKYLTLLLGVVSLVAAICVETNSAAASRISAITPEDAAAIQGAACPYVPMNPKLECQGAGSAGNCGATYVCGGSVCGFDCTVSVAKRSGPTFIKTTPCNPAVESAPKNCTTLKATSTREKCTVPWNPFASCYCAPPTTPVNCGAATFTELETCQ